MDGLQQPKPRSGRGTFAGRRSLLGLVNVRVLGAVLAVLLVSCAPPRPGPLTASPASMIDCGFSDLRPPAGYDAVALDCFWNAYSAGQPVRWSVVRYTVEGDPTPVAMTFHIGLLIVTRDMSKDRYSNQAARRLWTWQCAALHQRPWASDPQRYSFELSNCTGDGPTAVFP